MAARRCAILAAALGLAIWAAPTGASAQTAGATQRSAAGADAAEAFAQDRPRYRRDRPVVTVRPGRLLYRRCVGWLAVEHRLSGTVLVPRERCWWVRG
jgi:hypothetical protein